jgi:hypothetical protein
LTRGQSLRHPTISQVAREHGRTPGAGHAAVGDRTGCRRDSEAHPPGAIIENAEIFDFPLAPDVIAMRDSLDHTGGTTCAR